MPRRIVYVREGITWEEFKAEFGTFFPISHEGKRMEKLASEYTRLTGLKPEDQIGKTKRHKSKTRKADTGGNENQSDIFGEGASGDSD